MYLQNSSFLGEIMGNSPEIIHFESDLDPEPEKFSEHGARIFGSIRNPLVRPHTNWKY